MKKEYVCPDCGMPLVDLEGTGIFWCEACESQKIPKVLITK